VIAGKELKCYFHSHPQIPNVPNWSVDGIISHAKVNHTKPTDQHQESRKAILKSHADLAFRQKNYDCAAKVYDLFCTQTRAFVDCSWVMVKVLCLMEMPNDAA
jgi:hypothetical protein